jgi:hypothetical protein
MTRGRGGGARTVDERRGGGVELSERRHYGVLRGSYPDGVLQHFYNMVLTCDVRLLDHLEIIDDSARRRERARARRRRRGRGAGIPHSHDTQPLQAQQTTPRHARRCESSHARGIHTANEL